MRARRPLTHCLHTSLYVAVAAWGTACSNTNTGDPATTDATSGATSTATAGNSSAGGTSSTSTNSSTQTPSSAGTSTAPTSTGGNSSTQATSTTPGNSSTSQAPTTSEAPSVTTTADTSSDEPTGESSAATTTESSATNTAESSGGSDSVFPPGVTTPKLMIVGDSISAGPGCYKGFLDQNLKDNGITNYEFVGKYNDDCGDGIKHSAVSCSTTSDYLKDTFVLANASCSQSTFDGMAKLMAEFNPDLVMLQLGVNDVWDANAQIPPVLDNYTALVEQARAHNPNIVIVAAQIQKINTQQAGTPCNASDFSAKAKELVDAVPGWAQATNTEASPVFVADLWTNSVVTDTNDCVHPNAAGDEKMGQNWFDALKDILQ